MSRESLADLISDSFGDGIPDPEPEPTEAASEQAGADEQQTADGEPAPQEPTAEQPKSDSGESDRELPKWAVEEVGKQRARRREAEERAHDLEVRLAKLEGKIESGTQHEADGDDESSFYSDVKAGTTKIVEEKVGSLEQRIDARMLSFGVRAAMRAHDDYAEAEAKFAEAAKKAPALIHEMMSLPPEDRAEFAYQRGKLVQETAGFKSLDEWRAAEREKLRKEILEEKRRAKADAAAEVPETTAGERAGQTSASAADGAGEESLQELFHGGGGKSAFL